VADALADGYHTVPKGKLSTVVTQLEMRGGAKAKPWPFPDGVTLSKVNPTLDWYRDIFMRVGGMNWLWTSRLKLSDAELGQIIFDPQIVIWTVSKDGTDHGLLELDFRQPNACEIAFFGLTSELVGSGAGRALMATAQSEAWARHIDCLHLHTCTLDHPDALGFYIKNGFTPVSQKVEVFDDPRLTGHLPLEAGPRTPILPA
jgi:GNAT superfamily N-acetyltransferase